METFTEKQLIEFGNYLLSEERKKRIRKSKDKVHDADVENWKAKQSEQ